MKKSINASLRDIRGNLRFDENTKHNGGLMAYYKIDDLERRYFPKGEVRVNRWASSDPKITGYAALFNVWTDIGGLFKESIKPGAFAKTIKENDIRALKNHDEDLILGRNKAKPVPTLTLREDDTGLAVEIIPPETSYAKDLLVSMRRGDLNQMSFGFRVNKQEADYENNTRELVDVTLFDVSVVTFAAYPTTSAQVRSAFRHKKPGEEGLSANEIRDWDEFDTIIEKLKSGGKLTREELRIITIYIPRLSLPYEKKTKDKFTDLYIRAEKQIPSFD